MVANRIFTKGLVTVHLSISIAVSILLFTGCNSNIGLFAKNKDEVATESSGKDDPIRQTSRDLMLALVKYFEGYRKHCYEDVAEFATIGYGHLIDRKPCSEAQLGKFREGVDLETAEGILNEDLENAIGAVSRNVKVSLDNSQYSALVSFIYDVGETNFRTSTLLRKLNSGDYAGASEEFNRWVMAKGKIVEGLKTRRACETEAFLGYMMFLQEGELDLTNCVTTAFSAPPVSDPLDIVFGE